MIPALNALNKLAGHGIDVSAVAAILMVNRAVGQEVALWLTVTDRGFADQSI